MKYIYLEIAPQVYVIKPHVQSYKSAGISQIFWSLYNHKLLGFFKINIFNTAIFSIVL